MKYTRPDYYKDFTCIASECPDTCCANWQIAIDPKTLQKYKEVEGPFANRMNNSIDWKNGVFEQFDRRCTFLNDDKLCDIYLESGPDMMCKICKSYPRHTEEYKGNNDVFLSMSCPEVARIILSKEEPVCFTNGKKKRDNLSNENYQDFPAELYQQLLEARQSMLLILQNRKYSIQMRMSLVLALAHDIQNRIDRNQLEEITQISKNYEQQNRQRYLMNKIKGYRTEHAAEKQFVFRKRVMKELKHLYPLTKKWEKRLAAACQTLESIKADSYTSLKREFLAFMKEKKEGNSYEIQVEQLMVYFLFHYYCGAVYDEQEFAKVKYAAVSTMLIEELLFAHWLNKRRQVTNQDLIDIAYLYSREIEHSDENYLKLEKALIDKKMFELDHILVGIVGIEL